MIALYLLVVIFTSSQNLWHLYMLLSWTRIAFCQSKQFNIGKAINFLCSHNGYYQPEMQVQSFLGCTRTNDTNFVGLIGWDVIIYLITKPQKVVLIYIMFNFTDVCPLISTSYVIMTWQLQPFDIIYIKCEKLILNVLITKQKLKPKWFSFTVQHQRQLHWWQVPLITRTLMNPI